MRSPLSFAVVLLMSVWPAYPADQVIRNAIVVDIASGGISERQSILIHDGTIRAVGAGSLEIPAGAAVFDADGGYVIPGLWDGHVHVFSNPMEPAAAFPLYLLNGITGIRDMGGLLPFPETQRIAAAVESGDMLGPRVVLSGAWVDASPGSWPGMFLADTPDEARAVVDEIAAAGWAAVKSYSMLREAPYLALAAESETVGLPLVGHIPESVTLPDAIAAGHDVVEHFGRVTKACSTAESEMVARVRVALEAADPRSAMIAEMAGHNQVVLDTWDSALCGRFLATMAAAGTYVVPTLIVSDFYTGKRPVDLEARMSLLPGAVAEAWTRPDFRSDAMTDELRAIADRSIALDWRTFRLAYEAGVPVMAGSDASFANPYIFHGFSLLDELDRYVAAGLTPREALATATLAPAEFLGFSAQTGRIAPNMRADLVILAANPLEDLAALRRPMAVVVHGRLLDATALDTLRAALEAL